MVILATQVYGETFISEENELFLCIKKNKTILSSCEGKKKQKVTPENLEFNALFNPVE